VVAQTVAFLYAPEGGPAKSEEDRIYEDAPAPFGATVAASQALEQTVLETGGIEGVVLRFGWWYGPGTTYASDGYTAGEVRRRRLPIVGKGTGVFSFVHVDDVAAATIAALERGPPGVYNVVDDEPAQVAEWLPYYAELLGAKPPRRVPRWLARLMVGPAAAGIATELRGASNAKARRELGWTPRWRSWRDGFREAPGIASRP
jgi:nucleoside-diphosphate-sugar epimerase